MTLARHGLRRPASGPRDPGGRPLRQHGHSRTARSGEVVAGGARQPAPRRRHGGRGLLRRRRPRRSSSRPPAKDSDAILGAIDELQPGGSTNLEAGLRLGYEQARESYDEDAVNVVVLCSDGVANVGQTGPGSIIDQIAEEGADGIHLVTVGFGMGNYNDHLMEQLADLGDGFYSYVDTFEETERLFGTDLTTTLVPVAGEARAQVAFDPEKVASYRLVGYENRALDDDDFEDLHGGCRRARAGPPRRPRSTRSACPRVSSPASRSARPTCAGRPSPTAPPQEAKVVVTSAPGCRLGCRARARLRAGHDRGRHRTAPQGSRGRSPNGTSPWPTSRQRAEDAGRVRRRRRRELLEVIRAAEQATGLDFTYLPLLSNGFTDRMVL